jgi:hypothetical protein
VSVDLEALKRPGAQGEFSCYWASMLDGGRCGECAPCRVQDQFPAIVAALERAERERQAWAEVVRSADTAEGMLGVGKELIRLKAALRALYYASIEAEKFVVHLSGCPAVGATGPCDSGCQASADGLRRAIGIANAALAAAPAVVASAWTKDSLPPDDDLRWQWWTKRPIRIRMMPLDGPATITTRDAPTTVPSGWRGWLAVDPAGHPYPLHEDVHERAYEPALAEEARRGPMRQRDFLFTGGTDGATVLCRWCGWQVNRPRSIDHQKVYDLAEMHDCAGVETAAERDARELAEPAGEAAT